MFEGCIQKVEPKTSKISDLFWLEIHADRLNHESERKGRVNGFRIGWNRGLW